MPVFFAPGVTHIVTREEAGGIYMNTTFWGTDTRNCEPTGLVRFRTEKIKCRFFRSRTVIVLQVQHQWEEARYKLPNLGPEDKLPWKKRTGWSDCGPITLSHPRLQWLQRSVDSKPL